MSVRIFVARQINHKYYSKMNLSNLLYDDSFDVLLNRISKKWRILLLAICYFGLGLLAVSIFVIIMNEHFNTNINKKNVACMFFAGSSFIGIWGASLSSIIFLKNKSNKETHLDVYQYLRDGVKKSKSYLFCQLWTSFTFFISFSLIFLLPISILIYMTAPDIP